MGNRVERTNVTVPVIVKNIGGDLRLRGRNSDLIIEGDNVQVEQIGEGQPYVIRCGSDCRITVPESVAVVVQQVGGDAKITDIGGTLEIGAVGGDLVVRNAHGVQIKTVGSTLRVKWLEGPLMVKVVGSDATIRGVNGDVSVDVVGADLFLRGIDGNCLVERVGSDLVLDMDFQPGGNYRFQAAGDVLCRVEPETDARFVVPLNTEVSVDIPAEVTEEGSSQIVTLGAGAATVTIECDGEMRLVGEEDDYAYDLGAQIEEEVEARLSSMEEKLAQQLDGLDERIQAKAEQLANQATKFAEKFGEKADQFRRGADRRGAKPKGKRNFTFEWGWPTPPSSPPPPPPPMRKKTEPVSEQERLMILRMVQEGKITIEEAERLLSALDPQA
jgi:hypothetical protein